MMDSSTEWWIYQLKPFWMMCFKQIGSGTFIGWIIDVNLRQLVGDWPPPTLRGLYLRIGGTYPKWLCFFWGFGGLVRLLQCIGIYQNMCLNEKSCRHFQLLKWKLLVLHKEERIAIKLRSERIECYLTLVALVLCNWSVEHLWPESNLLSLPDSKISVSFLC